VPIDGLASTVRKNQIFWPKKLTAGAASPQNVSNDASLIEWSLPVTDISLDIIELAVVNALDDDQPA
jgi:hypothetical protein